jgi:hypothetical protein
MDILLFNLFTFFCVILDFKCAIRCFTHIGSNCTQFLCAKWSFRNTKFLTFHIVTLKLHIFVLANFLSRNQFQGKSTSASILGLEVCKCILSSLFIFHRH